MDYNADQISLSFLDISTFSNRADLIKGAPFDANGVSTAPIFYNVLDLEGKFWVFNYNVYYGCDNSNV